MIYHANIKMIKRDKGFSSVAAAAYRSCSKMYDKRTGETHDYRRKRHHQAGGICTPDNSEPPTREQLWQEAEAVERRVKSTVAQEWDIALPHELTIEQQNALARDIAQMIAHVEQTCADYNVHHPQQKPVLEQEQAHDNVHVHIMIPTRKWANGHLLSGRYDRTVNMLSTSDRKKLGVTQRKQDDVTQMRARIAFVINKHVAEAGLSERVDHRSLVDQQIDRTPQIHMGSAVSALERKGKRTFVGDVNREIIAENKAAEIAQNRPEIDFNESLSFTPTPTPKPSTSRTRARDEKPAKREQVQKPELPQLPMSDLSSLVSRDQLEAAADLSANFEKPDNMSFADYWTQIREALAKQQAELTEAQKDLLACAVTDAENPSHHPTDEIRAAIIARYGDTAEARSFAELLERQGRSDASIVVERHDELRHIDS